MNNAPENLSAQSSLWEELPDQAAANYAGGWFGSFRQGIIKSIFQRWKAYLDLLNSL